MTGAHIDFFKNWCPRGEAGKRYCREPEGDCEYLAFDGWICTHPKHPWTAKEWQDYKKHFHIAQNELCRKRRGYNAG